MAAVTAIAGCGGDSDSDSAVPSDAVARVGDTVITKQQARTFLPGAAKQAKARRAVAQYLVVAEWVRREAKREGVTIPAAMTKSALGSVDAGTADAVARVKVPLLMQALTKEAGGGAPSEQEIARYYREHPNEYAKPEVRYMRLVATDSQAQAAAAKKALGQGQSWKAVIGRYSTHKDTVTPPSGDMGAQPGEMPDPLGDALYTAERGTFNGPVKTDQAWYVFELKVIDRLPRQTLAQVRETLSTRLEARTQQQGTQALQSRMQARYRPITVCNDELLLPVCSNAPPAEPGSTLSFGL